MDSSQIAGALGVSSLTLSVLVAAAFAIARSCRSKCVIFGLSIDLHPATPQELAAGNAATQETTARDSVINVNVHTPMPQAHEEHARTQTHESTQAVEMEEKH